MVTSSERRFRSRGNTSATLFRGSLRYNLAPDADEVLRALTERGGMLGFSVYPHHLRDGSACSLQSFCEMITESADRYGAENLGIGTDLCQDQPDSVVEWMRVGRWSKEIDYGEGSADAPEAETTSSAL